MLRVEDMNVADEDMKIEELVGEEVVRRIPQFSSNTRIWRICNSELILQDKHGYARTTQKLACGLKKDSLNGVIWKMRSNEYRESSENV